MGKSQRTKGAVGEREVAHLFSGHFGREFKRNIGQARDGGNDLDIGPLVVEVKRRKTLGTVMGWLHQAADAVAGRDDPASHVPVVVGREDGGAWLVILGLDDFLKLTDSEMRRAMGETCPCGG